MQVRFASTLCAAATVLWTGIALAASLTLYTSQTRDDAAETAAAFERAHPEIKVNWTRSGASNLLTRIQAEHRDHHPAADVILLADALTMEALKADGLLARYAKASVGNVPPLLIDPDHYYFGTKTITTGIACRTDAPLLPTRWDDLLRPELRGRVILSNPVYSGTSSIFVAAMKADRRYGLEYFDRLRANGAVSVTSNADVVTAILKTDGSCGVVIDYMALQAAAKGAPIRFVLPVDGVSAASQPVAILADAANPGAARLFVDFTLSEAGQTLARQQGFYPADSTIPRPEGYPSLQGVHFMAVEPLIALYEAAADNLAFASLLQR